MKEIVIAVLTGLLLIARGALWGAAAVFILCMTTSLIDLVSPIQWFAHPVEALVYALAGSIISIVAAISSLTTTSKVRPTVTRLFD